MVVGFDGCRLPRIVPITIFVVLVGFEDFPSPIAGLYRSDGRDLRSAPSTSAKSWRVFNSVIRGHSGYLVCTS
jgi:hypothetical protein